MKLLILYQYFTTPNGRYSTRVYEFARRWVALGADVTVVTSAYDKSDLVAGSFMDTREIDGIKVKLLNLRVSNRQSFAVRVFGFLAYAITSAYYVLTHKADLVLCSSGPLSVGLPGLIGRWILGKPFVFEVRDLWPEGAIQLGVLRSPAIIGLSKWFERICYRHASAVVALSPDAAKWIEDVSGRRDVHVFPNACDFELANENCSLNSGRQTDETEIRGIYTGSLGKMNDSFQLLRIGQALKEKSIPCRIDVYGEGADLETLIQRCEQCGLDNLVFHRGVSKRVVFEALRRADFALLIFHDVPVMDTVSPNKMFDAFAMGVPIIQFTQGWIKRLLLENECGLTVLPGDTYSIADEIAALDGDRNRLDRMSKNAFRIAGELFDRDKLAMGYMTLLQECLVKKTSV